MTGKEQLIIELWDEMGRESAGAAELDQIQAALFQRLGQQGRESPAAIARILADEGVRLTHPQVLEADVRWRQHEVFSRFSPEELDFATIEAAVAWTDKLGLLPPDVETRKLVLAVKAELELAAKSMRLQLPERLIAAEVAQWLTVWLQNPPIFPDWLILRRQSAEFCARFKTATP